MIGLCPDPSHRGEFYMPLEPGDSRRCPMDDCDHELDVFVPKAHLDEVLAVMQPGEAFTAVRVADLEAIGLRVERAEAVVGRLRGTVAALRSALRSGEPMSSQLEALVADTLAEAA